MTKKLPKNICTRCRGTGLNCEACLDTGLVIQHTGIMAMAFDRGYRHAREEALYGVYALQVPDDYSKKELAVYKEGYYLAIAFFTKHRNEVTNVDDYRTR